MGAMRVATVAAVVASCVAAVSGAGAVTSSLADSKTPGMLISSSRTRRSGNLGFVAGANAGSLLRKTSPGAAISRPALKLRKSARSVVTMGASGQHLVTFGDVWNDICEAEGMEWDCPAGAEETLHSAMCNGIVGAAAAVGNCAIRGCCSAWDFLTQTPSADEVERNLQAFAKCHSGAVMPPLNEDQIGDQVKYYGIFPEMCSAMVDAEIDKALEDAESLEHEFTEKVRDLSKAKLRAMYKASQEAAQA